ncbi:3-oxoacyl-ACP reductase [Bacillus sp. V3B]|uniref:3-oxoacyl-ACP reductase n=1 Tax=Bacillus sp. V3B TaxID=2804915 RepID=UPI00210C588B|nr:3-oxoacyl-ACP reductase [Bacillus sp. V3B]MCQ6275573.1 3-oxoacyl-ACP reductase [Bacillus sp. V3B]
MEIKDQVVLVTGASRGLGAEIAKAFGREGARVIVNYHQSEQKAKEVVQSIGDRTIAIQANVTDKEQVQDMFAQAENHFGHPVTTVINNALVNFKFDAVNKKNAQTIEWEDYQTQLEGSVKAALHTTQAAVEGMSGLKFGRIINIGTNLVQNPVVPYHDYNTSKAALIGFTRTMARELGEKGITVNMVSGGLLQMTDASASTPSEVFELIKESTPLKRVTTPAELADATLLFASPWSRATTGQNLVVDGGLVMN